MVSRFVATFAIASAVAASGCIAAGEHAGGSDSEKDPPGCINELREAGKTEKHELKAGKFRPDRLRWPERPAKGESYADPAFGTCIVRLTDHRNEPPDDIARNYYSRFQPFNADESRVLVIDGDGNWHLYDAVTFEHLREMDLGGGSVEPQWHPSNPDVLFLLPNRGGLSMFSYNVDSGERNRIVDFTDLESIAGRPDATSIRDIWPSASRIWTHWEGSPSRDGRYWAFLVETDDGDPLGMITFDLAKRRILGSYDIREVGLPDHISMSPKGNYAVASWPEDAADCPWLRSTGTLEQPCGLMAFNLDFTSATALASKSPHSDIAINAEGREVIVISNYDSGNVEMIDLETGDVTPLWRIYIDGASTSMHISGKAYRKPGWVLISTYWVRDPEDAEPWYENRLMAVELKRKPRILNIATIASLTRSYLSEPHATVNRDFTRIVFNANWGTGKDEDIDVYLALLPDNAIPSPRAVAANAQGIGSNALNH